MGCFYLLHDNFLPRFTEFTSKVNAFSVSSTDASTAFGPVLSDMRSRPWRSGGYYKIESGSNTVVFEESSGVPLTATVTAGEYSSRTAFATALKSALDTAGDSTYTVSIDSSTKCFVITSNGSGGGGIFNVLWTNGSSTAMAEVIGFDSAFDSTGSLTYTADFLRIHTEEFYKIDFGLSVNPKAMVMMGARNSTIKLSDTAIIKLQGNETDVWTSPSFSLTLPYHPSVITDFDLEGFHTEALRFWRFAIIDKDNPLGYIEVNRFYLGDMYAPERGAVQFPFDSSLVDYSTSVTLESGLIQSDLRQRGQRFNLEWNALTKSEVAELIEIFNDHGRVKPLYFIADVNSAYSEEIEYYTRLVKFTSDPSYQLTSPNFFSMDMEFEEEV